MIDINKLNEAIGSSGWMLEGTEIDTNGINSKLTIRLYGNRQKPKDPEAWREEYRKKQEAGVRFQNRCGCFWQEGNWNFEGNKEDYREVPQESVAPQDDPFAPTSEDGHDCEGFPGGCNRFGCPGGDKCYMLNNQTPHAAERALWKAQREAGTNEVWQFNSCGERGWIDIPIDDEPNWMPNSAYRVKPMKLVAKIVRNIPMTFREYETRLHDWEFFGTREDYIAECEKYGYFVTGKIKEVGQVKPKTVKYYFALIRNKFGTVDSLAAASMPSFNKIANENSYVILGDIEEREIEA